MATAETTDATDAADSEDAPTSQPSAEATGIYMPTDGETDPSASKDEPAQPSKLQSLSVATMKALTDVSRVLSTRFERNSIESSKY